MSKNCSGCGSPMNDSAAVCPVCGKPAAQQPAQPKAADRPQHYAPQQKSRVPVIILAVVLSVLVVAGAAVAVILLTNKKDDAAKSDAVSPTNSSAPAASESLPVVNPTVSTLPPTEAPTDAPTEAPVSRDGSWVIEDGVEHYYIDGMLQTSTVVGDDENGWFYVDENGEKDGGYCDALTVDGAEWNVIEGKATRVEDEWDECLHSALYHVGQCTDSSMSREEKLRAAFEYCKRDDVFLEGVLHDPPYNEMDWPVVCANDLFVEGMGDCFSYGAAFAFIGKAIGYEECYACNTGGHGWAEINGRAYDVEWDMHHQEYNHFGVAPEDDCDVAYFTSITEGVDWMYVRV